MKSINDPFDPAALSDEELPEYVREYSGKRTEEDEWAGIKKYFETLCADLQDYRLETKKQALKGAFLADDPEMGSDFKYKHEVVVPFRKTDDQPMLEEQFRTAQSLIPKVRAGIEARTMTFDFMRDWGLLCYASGYVMCTWFARDSDDLASMRGGLQSPRRKHKLFMAGRLLPSLDAGKARKEAELFVSAQIREAIATNSPLSPLDLSELSQLLDDGGHLKTTYCGRKFTKKEMRALLADGSQ